MPATPFADLAQLGERLEATSKRLELAQLLADFFRTLAADELPPAVRLIIGQVFPEWDARALNLSSKAVTSVVEELIDASPELRREVAEQAVDPGEAVRMLFEGARRSPPQAPPLTILQVFDTLEQIAETAGKGSRAGKAKLLRGLFIRASATEAKFLVKVIYQEMRHGVSEGILLDGI